MAAGLLTEERLVLSNVPQLADVATMAALLAQHGIAVEPLTNDGRTLSIGGPITNTEAPYDIVRKMRASVLVLGPLLARVGEARVSLPGGCAIGTRPVDLHLKGLEQMGAVDQAGGRLCRRDRAARADAAPRSCCRSPRVGATENLLMAAALADGRDVLANAAREPEIADLARCLDRDGRADRGHRHRPAGDRGRARLHGAAHAIIPDRIETGTYACAAAITGGTVRLRERTARPSRRRGPDAARGRRGDDRGSATACASAGSTGCTAWM